MTYQVGDWVPLAEAGKLPRVGGLYIIRNTLNGKEYVGQSSNVGKRCMEHLRASDPSKLLYRAIAKHGVAAFEVSCHLKGEVSTLPDLEVILIAERGTLVPKGYNLTEGGEGSTGYTPTQETRARMATAQIGRTHSEATKERMRIARYANNHQKGVKLSEERKKTIAEMTRKLHTGVKRSPEACQRIKESLVEVVKNYKHSAEVRQRISERTLGKPKKGLSEKVRGEGNPMFGKPSANRKAILVWVGEATVPRVFNMLGEVAEMYGVSPISVSEWCREVRSPPHRLNIAVCYG